jgi:glycosyltransferase involved in cell wall biosynthesis
MEWQLSPYVSVITTQRRERSVARNTGAAIARGKYSYFLDDDDLMLPGALQAFWELSQVTNAAWLFGNYQVVDNDGNIIDEFHPNLTGNVSAILIAGESIPFQASFLRAEEFYRAGEFDVYFTGAQDRELGRRLSLFCDVAKTSALITQIRVGQVSSSTPWSALPEFDRVGREKALNRPGAFYRLWDSASGSGHLHGRVSRAYIASSVWNLKRKNIFIASSRLVSTVAFSFPYLFSADFWQGLQSRLNPLGEVGRTRIPTKSNLVPVTLISIILSIFILIIFPRRKNN